MIRNLVIAYIATWAIHLGYLAILTAKSMRLRREMRELEETQNK